MIKAGRSRALRNRKERQGYVLTTLAKLFPGIPDYWLEENDRAARWVKSNKHRLHYDPQLHSWKWRF